ncbi:transporter [Adhaeribacter terreus]|uniref:Transporter n=1 Tax=Adhaeribacter terreus TaxID=529703 RepID=A0ABW0ECR2_9BACT
MKKILTLVFACITLNAAFAQTENATETEEMETDRPGVGDGSRIVPQGYYQLETGLQYIKDETNFVNVRELHLPEIILRAGVLSFAELRVRAQYTRVRTKIIRTPLPENKFIEKGLDDIMLGTKIQLLQNAGARPEAALQADFRLPVGGEDFEGEKVEPKLRLALMNKLSERFSLHYNLGLDWEENQNPESAQPYNHIGLYTLALQYEISEGFMAFLEAVGEKHKKDMQQSFDAGLAYKIKPNLQLDAYAGYGISEEAPDFFASAGISFRLPK